MAGRLKTQKRWTFEDTYDYPIVLTKNPGRISVGFEWEVPESGEYTGSWNDYEVNLDTYSIDFVDMYRFNVHEECGGVEFASPVFLNIGQAKAMARKLLKRTAKDMYLSLGNPAECGIHVHASFPELSTMDCNEREDFYTKVYGMLNRSSTERFVYKFSRREFGYSYYEEQGTPTRWDCYSSRDSFEFAREHWEDYGYDQKMIHPNFFDNNRTIEYRLWASDPDILLPAIEFAHACTKFVQGVKEQRVPNLAEMKTWLDKQKGYKILKQQPEWGYIQ